MNWIDTGEYSLGQHNGGLEVLFAGDFFPGGPSVDLCTRAEFSTLFGDALPALREKDVSIVNLESPLTRRFEPIIKTGPHHSAPAECARALRFAGFDVAALANNHILDHGPAGIADTIDACAASGLRTAGAGQSLGEAQEPLYLETKSGLISIINVAENEFSIAGPDSAGANWLDPVSNYAQITKAKAKAQSVFVVIHGGHEFYPLPSPRMVETYRYFAALGVTAVIGHHSHVATGFEVFHGVPIFYSLGNFISDPRWQAREGWLEGYFVKLTVVDGRVSKFILYPYEQSRETGGLRLLHEEGKQRFLEKIAAHCDTIQDPVQLDQRWESFSRENRYFYLRSALRLGKIRRALYKFGFTKLAMGPRNPLVELLGLIRCEAHREALLKVLDEMILRQTGNDARRDTR